MLRDDKTCSKSAFTLAEVLITLAIIGIVAAMTIPSLIEKTNLAEYKAAWKKQYAQIKQAEQMMIANEGSITSAISNSSGVVNTISLRDAYLKYMKVSKKCDGGQNISKGCWYSKILKRNRSVWTTPSDPTQSGAILQDGTLIFFGSTTQNIIIDVNGFKGPNLAGIDVFTTINGANGQVPAGQGKTTFECASATVLQGTDCSAYYLLSD